MKKRIAILLLCLFCLAGCAQQAEEPVDVIEESRYMGTWYIYTTPDTTGGCIGKVELTERDNNAFSVEITDFIGAVDITVVKNAQFTEDGVGKADEPVTDGSRNMEMYFKFAKDAFGEETVVLEFAELNAEQHYALQMLYLYRDGEIVPAQKPLVYYKNRTVAEVHQDFGTNYTVEYDEGSDGLFYTSPRVAFLLGKVIDGAPANSDTLSSFYSMSDYPLVDALTGNMTYSELVAAVGDKATVPEPVEDLYSGSGYTLSFDYGEYSLLYWWADDPGFSASTYAWIR